jgi:hypothetical protein
MPGSSDTEISASAFPVELVPLELELLVRPRDVRVRMGDLRVGYLAGTEKPQRLVQGAGHGEAREHQPLLTVGEDEVAVPGEVA